MKLGWLWFCWSEDNRTFIPCYQLPGVLVDIVFYKAFIVLLSSSFGLSLLHMQPGIIAEDEVKPTLRCDVIFPS